MRIHLPITLFSTFAAACLLPAVPPELHYQGRLVDSGGAPVTGNVNMGVRIFAAASGGGPLYEESIGAVAVNEGVYAFSFGVNGYRTLVNEEVIAQTNSLENSYSKTLDFAAIPESIDLTDGEFTWSLSEGSSDPLLFEVNYDEALRFISITYNTAPSDPRELIAEYQYEEARSLTDLLDSEPELYLELLIDGIASSARTRLLAVPYALQSADAQALKAQITLLEARLVSMGAQISLLEARQDSVAPMATMVSVPAGSFFMGDLKNEGYPDELPVHQVTLSAYAMQATEVTNAQMATVMNWAFDNGLVSVSNGVVYNVQGVVQPLLNVLNDSSQIRLQGDKLAVEAGKENYPCIFVSWYGAMAYCHFLTLIEGGFTQAIDFSNWSMDINASGYRLPTEAEWERAAGGGFYGNRFPWGDTISHDLANYFAFPSLYDYDLSPTIQYHPDWNTGVLPYTSPVGSFSANAYGLYDMAGNVEEWCWDLYAEDYYGSSPETNPMGPSPSRLSGTNRVARGGSFTDYPDENRVSWRDGASSPNSMVFLRGFRPVRSE